ncbi:SgcJ/EcaC family oxidoreductase [Nocardiopsis sp. CNT-189]|uniref:SgcJ/EcaC family oxidoreductase n=1 Tax=Nocardiopsis oceanisediminis TaxID=2816862 RepID=UPI003B2C74E6
MSKTADVEALKQLLVDMAEAWNAGDGAGYAAPFLDDATYISYDGQLAEGRQVIQDVHQMLFDGPLKGSRMDDSNHHEPRIRLLTDDSAVVISIGGVSIDGGEPTDADRASIITLTTVRKDGAWRIASFQNTRQQPQY